MGAMFPFFQSLRTSPDCQGFSNMMESGLARVSASSDVYQPMSKWI